MFGWEYRSPFLQIEAPRQKTECCFRSMRPGFMWVQFQASMCFRICILISWGCLIPGKPVWLSARCACSFLVCVCSFMVAEHGSTWWDCGSDDDTNQEHWGLAGTFYKSMLLGWNTTATHNVKHSLYNIMVLALSIQHRKSISSKKKAVDITLNFLCANHTWTFDILMQKHLNLLTKCDGVSTQVGAHNRAQQGSPKLGSGNGPFLYVGRTGYVCTYPVRPSYVSGPKSVHRMEPLFEPKLAPHQPPKCTATANH